MTRSKKRFCLCENLLNFVVLKNTNKNNPSLPACNSYAVSIAGRAQLVNLMFYTYVLKSKKDGKLYVGFSSDLKQRLQEHNKGLVEATKSRIPFEIVYYEACLNQQKAVEREKVLKTGFGRAYLKRRL